MKKHSAFSLILITLALMVFLTGCITVRDHYDSINVDEVTSIDIYDLREVHYGESGFWEEIDPVYTLDESMHSEFFDDLSDIEFTDTLILFPAAVDPSFYYGEWVVRINFSDNSYGFISSHGYGESFDADGNLTDSNHFGCDDEIWERLVTKYLPEDLITG